MGNRIRAWDLVDSSTPTLRLKDEAYINNVSELKGLAMYPNEGSTEGMVTHTDGWSTNEHLIVEGHRTQQTSVLDWKKYR